MAAAVVGKLTRGDRCLGTAADGWVQIDDTHYVPSKALSHSTKAAH